MQTVHTSPYAGQWYPADSSELRHQISDTLRGSEYRTGTFIRRNPIAFIVPHAAPMYSGTVAAAAYRHIERAQPRRIVLLGFSHRRRGDGIAVPQVDNISTPLGASRIDVETARALAQNGPFISSPEQVLCDHSVEIQLPFLQMVAPDAVVLPLYVGRLDREQRELAAARLRWLIEDGTVLVASSDLTHYGADFGYLPFPVDECTGENLRDLDAGTISAASSLDPEVFLQQLRESGSTVCGSEPIALLLETLRGITGDELFQERLDYQTSGEITGDYEHSVSYGALGYFPYSAFRLSDTGSAALIDVARFTIERLRTTGEPHPITASPMPELSQRLGAFVTLYQGGELHGCIGRCHDPEPLSQSISRLTISAALDDDRFEPLRQADRVDIEISVLSPLKCIRDPRQLIAGEHGGLLETNGRAGCLLPKVASEMHWDKARFLKALARKAGVPADVYGSAGARLSVFRAQVLRDEKYEGTSIPAGGCAG